MADTKQAQSTPATTAGTVAPGGAPPFPPFDPAQFSSTLFWLVVVVGLIYVLMSKVALPRVEGILTDRRRTIDADFAAAREAKAQADLAAAGHVKALAAARTEAQGLAQKTRDDLNAKHAGRQAELETGLNAKLADAEAQIATTKAAAMTHVQAIAHDTASAIFERITGQAADADAIHAALAATSNN